MLRSAVLAAALAGLAAPVAAAAASTGRAAAPGKRPPTMFSARVARWLVHETVWGSIATISNGHDSGTVGNPFVNPMSHSDGIANATDPKQQSTGTPYFLMTGLDETPQDLELNPVGSFSISEDQLAGDSICMKTDGEDPVCARISLTGKFVDVTANGTKAEQDFGLQALYTRHPEFPSFGPPGTGDHNFHVWKLVIESIFFIDFYGGAAKITADKYYASTPFTTDELEAHLGGTVTVGPWPKKTQVARPPANNSAAMARWLVHQTVWGTIGTISNGHDSGTVGNAFANPQSFSDGIANATDPKQQSTGTPYFLMTGLDETPQDLKVNPVGSFAVSEAQITGDTICAGTDPEDPTCARVSFTGTFVDVTLNGTKAEQDFGLQALYSRHPEFPSFGPPGTGDHDFHVWKLVIKTMFILDFYGGATPVTPSEYYAASPFTVGVAA